MKNLLRDAASLLGFPWSKPAAPTARSTTSSGFVDTVTDADLEGMFNRNQAAHAVVADVATDAMTSFTCIDSKGEKLEKFNGEVQTIFAKFVSKPLTRSLIFTRLYGHCGLLIGYEDGRGLEKSIKGSPKVQYLQAIPKPWINDIVLKKDKEGGLLLPPELDRYTISISHTQQNIDASRITHLRIPSLKEESLEGESVLLCIHDDLTSMKSMTWGFGQAAWRHGGGLTAFVAPDSTDPQAQIDAIDELVTDINAMTVLTLPYGSQMLTEKGTGLSPKEYFDVCLQAISIGSRIPVSILRGSVAGSLTASEKDRKDYFELLDNIQKELLTPALMDILQRFQLSGQLPQQEFLIKWDRTPIWMLEEQKGKLFVAQTELAEAKTKTETNIARKTYIEYRDLKSAREAKTDSTLAADVRHGGLIVPHPHGELLWRGIQKAIAKPASLGRHVGEPMYLVSDGLCYGLVMLDAETILSKEEFATSAPKHMMADDAKLKGKQKIFYYDVKLLTLFSEPKRCETPQGAWNYAKRVEFVE